MNTAIGPLFLKRNNNRISKFPVNAWFDKECKDAKMLHNRGRNIISEQTRHSYNSSMRNYKALIQRQKRQYHQVTTDVKQLHKRDPQGYWQFWKRHRQWTQNYDLLDPSIFTAYYKNMETKPIDELFNNQFMADIEDFISQYKEGSVLNTNCVLDDILNAPIKIEETLASLKRMKTNKAAGTDGIPVEFYRYCRDFLSQPSTALFNPWGEGVMNPLHKPRRPGKLP